MTSISPFEFIKTINMTKDDIMVDDIAEKDYNSFVINRSLSYFPDTVLAANAVNQHHHMDARLQYDFLRTIVRKRKRFSKWDKPTTHQNLKYIKEYYGYNDEKSLVALKVLTDEQVKVIKHRCRKGGVKR